MYGVVRLVFFIKSHMNEERVVVVVVVVVV